MSTLSSPRPCGYFTMRIEDETFWHHFDECLKFIRKLKDLVPAESRSYDEETKTWHIRNDFHVHVKALHEGYFGLPNLELF